MQDRLLKGFYLATALFLLLDYAAGLNFRLAFLDGAPVWRGLWYALLAGCAFAMYRRPEWTTPIAAIESLATLIGLILVTGARVMLVSDAQIEGVEPFVNFEEILNFLLSGAAAYLSWLRAMRRLFPGV